MQITEFLSEDRILARMQARSKDEALVELAEMLAGDRGDDFRDQIARVLQERERLASTGIGAQVAIPHGKLDAVGTLLMGLGRSEEGIDFESVDGEPTHLFFVLVAPEKSTGDHLKALARIARLCREEELRQGLLSAKDSAQMFELLRQEDSKYWTG